MIATGAYLDWLYDGDEFDDRANVRRPQATCENCIEVNYGNKD